MVSNTVTQVNVENNFRIGADLLLSFVVRIKTLGLALHSNASSDFTTDL